MPSFRHQNHTGFVLLCLCSITYNVFKVHVYCSMYQNPIPFRVWIISHCMSIPHFFFFWLCWVFVSVQGLSLVVASGGHSSSRCVGLSLLWPLLLQSTGSRRAGSVVVAHGLVAPRHMGSSQTRARTHVPCIGRQFLNHCATREAPVHLFFRVLFVCFFQYSF